MIVLDTHVLIWSVQGDGKLGSGAVELIEGTAGDGELIVPAICAWEIAQIEKRGKGGFPYGALAWFKAILAKPAFTLSPIEPEIAMDSVLMEWSHKDPADRLIVATARYLGIPLLTADTVILAHAAAGHVEAIDARR